MIDLERSDARDELRHRRERHDRSLQRPDAADAAARRGGGRSRSAAAGGVDIGLEVDLGKPRRVGLELGQAFEDHLIIVGWRVDRLTCRLPKALNSSWR